MDSQDEIITSERQYVCGDDGARQMRKKDHFEKSRKLCSWEEGDANHASEFGCVATNDSVALFGRKLVKIVSRFAQKFTYLEDKGVSFPEKISAVVRQCGSEYAEVRLIRRICVFFSKSRENGEMSWEAEDAEYVSDFRRVKRTDSVALFGRKLVGIGSRFDRKIVTY